jgi:hypothetical protein
MDHWPFDQPLRRCLLGFIHCLNQADGNYKEFVMIERESPPFRDVSEMDYGEINKELDALKDKADPVSIARFHDLEWELVNIDMAMGPARRAMGRRKKPVKAEAERTLPDDVEPKSQERPAPEK